MLIEEEIILSFDAPRTIIEQRNVSLVACDTRFHEQKNRMAHGAGMCFDDKQESGENCLDSKTGSGTADE